MGVRGRPGGKGPTMFWTAKERALVRAALNDLVRKIPRHTQRAIISLMLRMESGEFDD